jgi:hypothetical protein
MAPGAPHRRLRSAPASVGLASFRFRNCETLFVTGRESLRAYFGLEMTDEPLPEWRLFCSATPHAPEPLACSIVPPRCPFATGLCDSPPAMRVVRHTAPGVARSRRLDHDRNLRCVLGARQGRDRPARGSAAQDENRIGSELNRSSCLPPALTPPVSGPTPRYPATERQPPDVTTTPGRAAADYGRVAAGILRDTRAAARQRRGGSVSLAKCRCLASAVMKFSTPVFTSGVTISPGSRPPSGRAVSIPHASSN